MSQTNSSCNKYIAYPKLLLRETHVLSGKCHLSLIGLHQVSSTLYDDGGKNVRIPHRMIMFKKHVSRDLHEMSQRVTGIQHICIALIHLMATSFSYPNVELQEIALVVHSWGYPITEDDLRPPKGLKPEVVQMVYACAIQKLTGLTIAELEKSAERSLAVIDEWQVNLFNYMQKSSLIAEYRRSSLRPVRDYMYFYTMRMLYLLCLMHLKLFDRLA